MSKRTGRPTLDAIAKRTGFAKASVGYILRGQTAAFAPATVALVQQAAAELGYRPNSAARAMATRRFGQVGLLLSAGLRRSLVGHEQLIALAERLAAHHLTLALSACDDARLTDATYVPNILRELMVDGLISAYSYQVPPGMSELIERHRLPCVWLNLRREADAVHPDDVGAARAATERLLLLGHRAIAYLDYDIGLATPEIYRHYSMADRLTGYSAAMTAAGLAPRRIAANDRVAEERRLDACRAWMREPDRPTAVLAYGAVTARSVIAAALAEGLRLPADLSLVTFGNAPVVDLGVAVETMVIDDGTIAANAVDMLMQRIASPQVPRPSIAVPMRLAEGHSTAPIA